MLQKYDLERDNAQSQRIAAAAWGGEPKEGATTPSDKPPRNGKKHTMTAKDIMGGYAKQHGI